MPVPSIRSLWRRFSSNVRVRGGRNSERIGQHAPYIPPRGRTPRRLRAPSPRLRGVGWDEGALPQD
jgi:hypothetical protein